MNEPIKSETIFFGKMTDDEKRGIDILAKALPAVNYVLLAGRLIPGIHTVRELDAVLVCPKGIFIIEMKEYRGRIKDPLGYAPNIQLIDEVNRVISKPNPLIQVRGQSVVLATFLKNKVNRIANPELYRKITDRDWKVQQVIFFCHEGIKYSLEADVSKVEILHVITPAKLQFWTKPQYSKNIFTVEEIKRIVAVFGQGSKMGKEFDVFAPETKIEGLTIKKLLHETEQYKMYLAYNEMLEMNVMLKVAYLDPGQVKQAAIIQLEIGQRDAKANVKLRGEKFAVFPTREPFLFGNYIISVTEWFEHKTLEEIMQMPRSVEENRKIARVLIDIIDRIHQKEIIHRDLSPKNIVLQTSDGEWKVLNFDFARLAGKPTIIHQAKPIQLIYRAPEVVNFQPGVLINNTADYFSVGMIVKQLFKGQTNEELNRIIDKLISVVLVERETGYRELKQWMA